MLTLKAYLTAMGQLQTIRIIDLERIRFNGAKIKQMRNIGVFSIYLLQRRRNKKLMLKISLKMLKITKFALLLYFGKCTKRIPVL